LINNKFELFSFTNEVIRKLIDYSTKMPSEDNLKTGHKYPFNACEILCSDNPFILDKIIDNTKLANEDDDSDDSYVFKEKGKKLSVDNSSRKNSTNSYDSNSDNYSDDNEIVFFNANKKAADEEQEQENQNENYDRNKQEKEKKELVDNSENDEENIKNDLSENILKENFSKKNENNKEEKTKNEGEKDSINNNVEKAEIAESQQHNEKSLLEKNKDDELNFVSAPEICDENNVYDVNVESKTDKDNNENNNNSRNCNKKVNFMDSSEDFNQNHEENYKSHNIKRGFHQKKRNLDNININMEKLISENIGNIEANNNNEAEDKEIFFNINTNNNQQQNSENKETDIQELIDLSDEKSKDHSSSSINNSIKSEFATYSFPNLDHLFEFLDEGDELNYVLSGYFFKIFNHMLNCKKASLIKYIYKQNIYILDKLIKNVHRKSICDCLCKVLTMHVDEATVPNASEIKNEMIQRVFLGLRELDFESLTNVSEMFVECLKNKQFYFNFISSVKIFEIIKDLLINAAATNSKYELIALSDNSADFPKVNKNEIYKNLLKILNQLDENILRDFGTSIVTPSLNCESDSNVVNFQSINLEAGLNAMLDEDLCTIKVEPIEIKMRLEKIYNLLCEISYTIIEEYINSDKNEKEKFTVSTTFDIEKRILGTKRYFNYS